MGIYRVVGIVGTYGALLLGTCFGKGSIPLVSGRWDPGYFREIYVFFFLIMARKNDVYLKHKIDALKRTKRSHHFAKENHLPFFIQLRDCGRCHYFFGSHLVLFSAAFLLIHKKWVKFSTPNPGWKKVC